MGKTFATWNEGNHCGEPVCHRPELTAAYYNAERRVCPSCTILAAEVLDQPGMLDWIRDFERKAKGDPRRRIWGIHNYVDANRLRTIGTRRLLAHTRGPVWFTETGGIVYRRNRSHITFPESKAHAAIATRWLFRKLIPLSSRITRVYSTTGTRRPRARPGTRRSSTRTGRSGRPWPCSCASSRC